MEVERKLLRKRKMALSLAIVVLVISLTATTVSAYAPFTVHNESKKVISSLACVSATSYAYVSASAAGGRVYTRSYHFFGFVQSNWYAIPFPSFPYFITVSSQITDAYVTVSGIGFSTITLCLARNSVYDPDESPYVSWTNNLGVINIYYDITITVGQYLEPWGQSALSASAFEGPIIAFLPFTLYNTVYCWAGYD